MRARPGRNPRDDLSSGPGPAPAQLKTSAHELQARPHGEYLLARTVGEDPVSNAEVLYDEIPKLGYRGGRSILKEFTHPIRALANKTATVSVRDSTRT
ncbi:MAG: hypothetical protein E6I73_03950 [Chloroflexi bacterium]|nr:MAG: hypothetical protein E6I73_03950 [Chloroflexota bacterium]